MSADERNPDATALAANTADVTLTFACWLADVRHKFWVHFIHEAGALKDVKLWDWGEDGGFYHWYKTQHESSKFSRHEYPASRDHATSFYDGATLPRHRPTDPHFSKSSYSYPLQDTREIVTCPDCSGSGQVRCGRCGGSGRCSNCKGHGQTGSGSDAKRCSSCGGNGRCSKCSGTGKVRCDRCSGEGELLRYTSKDYKWWHDHDDKPILSKVVDRFGVKKMIKAARKKGGGVVIEEFSEDEVLSASGVLNDRIRELILLANTRRRELESEISSRSDLVVFQHNERQYIPFSYINMSAGGRYGQFFAAGTEQHNELRAPRLPLDLWKCAFWLSLVASVVVTASTSPGPWVLAALWVLTAGLLGVSLYRLSRELKEPAPARWLIFDDDEHGAWEFAFALAQAVSRARVGRVSDPWFTALLEPPSADSIKGRNSFMYTIRHKQPEGPRQTEILLLGKRAQGRYAPVVAAAVQSATRLVWLAGGRTAEELDEAIAETVGRVAVDARARLEVAVICDARARPLTAEHLSRASEKLGPGRLQVLDVPLREMCQKTLSGGASEATEMGFHELLAHSGCMPTPADAPESEEQSPSAAETG
jgi:hypothetical protein